MASHENLIAEAEQARRLFEQRLAPTELLRDLYLSYNPSVEIDSFLERAARLFPRLNCGLTAVYLRHQLRMGEVRRGSYDGTRHTFVELGGLAIDITADQFGGPPVYVGPVRSPWSLEV
ncbi:MAG TPA: hypothetical protein VLG37_05280 [Candidatus Saccharimonadales bacterium]|nr:hypothetical protein [Candidatus Saccharimonadales bacterium]